MSKYTVSTVGQLPKSKFRIISFEEIHKTEKKVRREKAGAGLFNIKISLLSFGFTINT